MNNGQYNNLDKQFRDAAKNAEPEFDPAAWKRMEAKLNKEERAKRRFFWWWMPVILLLGGAAFYLSQNDFISQNPTIAERSISENRGTQSQYPNPSDISPIEKLKVDNDTKQSPPVTPVDEQQSFDPVYDTKEVSDPEYKLTVKPKRNSFRTHTAGSRILINAAEADEEKGLDAKYITDAKDKADLLQADPEMNLVPNPERQITTVQLEEEPSVVDVEKLEQPLVEVPQLDSTTTSQQKKPSAKRGLFLWAAGGPEASAVALNRLSTSGVTGKWGLGAGYRINDRWSVLAGAYRVNKRYNAGKDDYRPKGNSYLPASDSFSVRANCAVWEFPLLVRYNLNPQPSVRFFLSAGVAGVVMQNEDYRFNYTLGTAPYVYNYTEEKTFTGNRHVLAVARFGAGVQKQLFKKFVLHAEPYLQLPLSGVGEGRVKLFSLGAEAGISFMPF